MRSPRQWISGRRRDAGLRETLARVSASEHRFRELADVAPVLIWTCDASGMVDFVNRGWLELTGRDAREELGDSWTVGVHPEDAGRVRATWWEAYEERGEWECEYRLRTREGGYRWIVDRGAPRFDEGKFVGFVGTAVDIHERKGMEERLASAYARDHEVAETLQRSLLPEGLPPLPGIAIEARYLPASEGGAIGGDWYDAVELDDSRVAVVVGDVVGHGLRAAATMGQLRNAFRAYALLGSSPAATFEHMNRLLSFENRNMMATALYAVIDRDTGDVEYASAGHPPGIVVGAEGVRFLEGGRSVPLGTTPSATYGDARDRLDPGSMLLLYTDGLIERRGETLDSGLQSLADTARVGAHTPEEVCDAILGQLDPEGMPDDVALLAVRLEPIGERMSLALAADPAVLAGLRRRLGRFLDAAGATPQEHYEITLTICEAAANAIEHAYGPADAEFALEVGVEEGEVWATVTDAGSWRKPREAGGDGTRGRGLGIIQGLMDEVDVSRSDIGTTVRMRRKLKLSQAA